MNISKRGLYALISGLIVLANAIMANTVNLVENGDFEEGKNTAATFWSASGWSGADGKYGRSRNIPGASGDFCYELKRANGKGGLQLFSQLIKINGDKPVELSFKYKGKAYVQLRFERKENGKFARMINSFTRKPVIITATLSSETWKEYKYKVKLPAEYAEYELGVRIYFLLFPDHPQLSIDDVKIIQPDSPEKTVSREPGRNSGTERLRINPPKKLTPVEQSWYSPFPDPGFKYGLKNGVLTRDGEPFFYTGNFTVGGGQWNVSSSWLARVQKNSYLTVTWSIGNPSMKLSVKNDHLNIGYKDTAPLYSWIRELSRYGMLTQFDPGNAMYKYNPMRHFVKKFPEIKNFYVNGSHFYSFDHNTEIGRELHFNSWKNYFKYIRNAPLLAFECFNELGYTPSHRRVTDGFRVFAKKKYGSLKAANLCWKTNFKSWDEVISPHLGNSSGMMSYSEKLFFLNKCRQENIYYDWLIYLQKDLIPGLVAMKKDFRKLSDAPFSVDWRGHCHEFDNYVTSDLDLLDNIVDVYFLHTAFPVYDYNGTAADQESVMKALTRSLLAHNYVASNSSKPIINPESIYSLTTTPGSNMAAMEKNSFAKLHGKWQFTLEQDRKGIEKGYFKSGYEDKNWGSMDVPGCWDATEEFKGKNGWGWYRTTFKMPGNVKMSYIDGSRKFLIVGKGVAQSATIWLNGHKIGTPKGWATEYKYDVGAYLNFGGKNTLAILVDGTTSYSNGIRFYLHLLADDMLNERRMLARKEYASILWTNLVSGCSGITLWNWDDAFRPFMPELETEINSVSRIILPSARKSNAKTAILMPYLYFRGLPAYGNHLDYLAYFSAMTFLQTPVDVLSEKNFSTISPEKYPFVIIPYAKTVYRKTYNQLVKYVNDGGLAIITFDSLVNDFDRFSRLPIESLAGVKVTGKIINQETIVFDGKELMLMKTDMDKYYGVKINPSGNTKVIARYKDKSPAITVRETGRGKICFIAGRLNLEAAYRLLGKLLKEKHIKPELDITTSSHQEFPFIQSRYFGTPERFIIYLHNWGGQNHRLKIKLSADQLISGDYAVRSIRSSQNIAHKISSAELLKGIEVVVESMNPVAILMEAEKQAPLKPGMISPLREKILKQLADLNSRNNWASPRPKILFMDDIKSGGNYAVGRKLYPLAAEFMEKAGYDTVVLPWQDFSSEKLKKVRTIFLAEDISNNYSPIFKQMKGKFIKTIIDFVKNGGSLILVNSSAHPNSRHELLDRFGRELGFSTSWSFSRNPASCGYGDPLQLKIKDFSNHPLAMNMKSMQLFITPVFHLKKNSIMTPVANTSSGDLINPSMPVVIAGQLDKGRIIACTDLLWLQPFRLEAEDNAQFLMNMAHWTLGEKVKKYSRKKLDSYIFINSKLMQKIEQQESVR